MTTQILAVRQGTNRLLRPGFDDVPELLRDPEMMIWVCMDSDGERERKLLGEVFEIHPLLVEDAFNESSAPKLEDHQDYLYIILHGLKPDAIDRGHVDTADLDVFLGRTYLITHYHKDLTSVQRVLQAVEKDPSLLGKGPAVVAHRLFDHMIDQYLPLMERLDDSVSRIEEEVMAGGNGSKLLEEIFQLKRDVVQIRRIGLHQREILHRLWRGDFPLIPAEILPFYRDVYDHFVRVTDETEGYREMVGASLEAHISVQSHKLNEIMKVLTLISTVVLPLNFITGLYGMNFDFMPGLHWKYGYETALAAMVLTVTAMVIYFRRQKWL